MKPTMYDAELSDRETASFQTVEDVVGVELGGRMRREHARLSENLAMYPTMPAPPAPSVFDLREARVLRSQYPSMYPPRKR